MSANLCRVKGSFRPYQNENNSVKDTGSGKKAKNHLTFTQKLPKKIFSTTHLPFLSSNPKILKPFLKTFPTKMKPTNVNAQQKEKKKKKKKKEKTRQEKRRKRGERKPKGVR